MKERKKTPRVYTPGAVGSGWRERLSKAEVDWTTRNPDEVNTDLENLVYQMALEGNTLKGISNYLGIADAHDFIKTYLKPWRAGHAELDAMVRQVMVERALEGGLPVDRIFAAKALLGMSDSGGIEVESKGSPQGGITWTMRVRKAGDEDEAESVE